MIPQILKHLRIQACTASFAAFFCLPLLASAQNTAEVHIFSEATVYAHPNSFTNIFSDVSNSGTIVTAGNSLVNFYSRIWNNQAGSHYPDESSTGIDGTGGVFRFVGLSVPQRILSSGSLPYEGFPNLRIDNTQNVTIETGNLHVNHTLDFVNGKIILSNVDLSVGRNGSGTITGFDRTRYIVTGPAFTGGNLVRSFSGSATTATDYPIGTSTSSYTPASVIYKGIPQTIRMRVGDNVYEKFNFSEYLNKTWVVKREQADPTGTMTLTLQHNSADEGIEYFRNRTEAYITRYDPKITGLYDIVPPQPTATPGTISARAAVANAFMNTRLNVGVLKDVEYFTKTVIKTLVDENTPVNIPDAISPNGDGFNDTYIVEKRLPTDKVRFEVYTRNQVPVYQHLDYDDSFNGTGNLGGFMGNVLPDGIYYYLISVNGAKGIPGYLIINR